MRNNTIRRMIMMQRVPTYAERMIPLFDIQVLPLDDLSGTAAVDKGNRKINGTYANTSGLTLNNALSPFKAPILGATSYVNHNAASIASFFSYSAGSYHYWVRGSLALWDDANLRRLNLMQVDTSNRIDVTKNAGLDTITIDYKATASNTVTVANMTYTSGWIPIGLRWNKTADAFDVFVNGHKVATISSLGNVAGTIAQLTAGVSPNFPAGSLAYLGVGSGLVTDANFALLSNLIRREKLILFDGDSLTVGLQNGAVPYPKQLMRLYYSDTPVPNNVGYNKGVSSTGVSDMITSAPTAVDPYISDSFASKVCVICGGTNDITVGTAAATIEANLVTYWQARRAAGWKIVACTIIPNGAHTVGEQAVRDAVNTWIKANYSTYCDGLADPTASAEFDQQTDTADTTYYNADTIHLTTAGYGVVAAVVKAAVDALP